MKILINCYACSPYKGSEPGMGWNFVKCLSQRHELHIITEKKFQKDLEQYFFQHPEEKEFFHFYFIRKERHKKLRKLWPPSYYWFYKAWQKKALKLAMELDKEHNVDIVHQLNMVGYREPGYLWKLGKPTVWGPIGGFNITPWCMLPSMGMYGMFYYAFRNIINYCQIKTSGRVKQAMKSCKDIIAATEDDRLSIERHYGRKPLLISEVGLIENAQKANTAIGREGKLRICWSGVHEPRKSLNLLLEAISQSPHKNHVELHIIGKGKCTERWRKMAIKLHLNEIHWYGWIAKDKATQIMKDCHLFAITSLSDATSTVLLEALSYGLPVIALNHCGFANVINETCGIKINIQSKRQVVDDFAKAIEKIQSDESYRLSLSQGALRRAQDFSWDKKAEIICAIYNQI